MSFGVGADDLAEDYSTAATVIHFDPPLPLLRATVPSPAPGEGHVLAFRDAASSQAAWDAAEASLVSQCEAGARSGCSIAEHFDRQIIELVQLKREQIFGTGRQASRYTCSKD